MIIALAEEQNKNIVENYNVEYYNFMTSSKISKLNYLRSRPFKFTGVKNPTEDISESLNRFVNIK